MPVCERCGRPLFCGSCTARDELSLLRLPEKLRMKVQKLMDDFGFNTSQQESIFIKDLLQYRTDKILRAIITWNKEGYASQGYGDRYFMGILRKLAVRSEVKLEPLPKIHDPRKEG